MANTSWARGATMPNQFRISRRTFEELEDWIRDNEASIIKANQGMDALTRLLILVVKGNAQSKTMGPVAVNRRSNPALAHRIPVQRITGRYFAGWTVKRLRNGVWMVYNETRAAYVVEFGIGQRQRRPILKTSVLDMLRFVQATRTGDRFVDWVFAPRRNSKGQFQSFESRLGNKFKLSLTANDLPGRGISNPNLSGPLGTLPG